jgi:myo-inositol-1(or 4)-monophosphatase
MNKQIDLLGLHQSVAKLARQIKHVQLEGFNKALKITEKSGVQASTSIVTEIDESCHELSVSYLSKHFPDSGIISEEQKYHSVKEYNWVVDPLDGTLNYSRGIPLFGFSISYWHLNQPVYALNIFPALNLKVYAIEGRGMKVNGRNVHLKAGDAKEPQVVYSHVGTHEEKIPVADVISATASFPRYFGGSVYHAVLVGTHQIETGIFINNAIWDIAAGILFAREMGLGLHYISSEPDLKALPDNPYSFSIVMGVEPISKQLSDKIKVVQRREND